MIHLLTFKCSIMFNFNFILLYSHDFYLEP